MIRRGGFDRRSLAAGASGTGTTASGSAEERIGERFKMRQRLFAISGDYWIESEQGQPAFLVDGIALRARATLLFIDLAGNEVYRIQEKMLRLRDSMCIHRGSDLAAKVHNARYTPLSDRFRIAIPGGSNLTTHGSVLYHDYQIERDGVAVARISKRWFRISDTYGVEVAPNEDALLMLAITAIIDVMSHEGR